MQQCTSKERWLPARKFDLNNAGIQLCKNLEGRAFTGFVKTWWKNCNNQLFFVYQKTLWLKSTKAVMLTNGTIQSLDKLQLTLRGFEYQMFYCTANGCNLLICHPTDQVLFYRPGNGLFIQGFLLIHETCHCQPRRNQSHHQRNV